MRFILHDIVKISRKSEYYLDDYSDNPRDIEGKIDIVSDSYIHVTWSDGNSNGYSENDLRLVRREEQSIRDYQHNPANDIITAYNNNTVTWTAISDTGGVSYDTETGTGSWG